jgi:hypothetical protein
MIKTEKGRNRIRAIFFIAITYSYFYFSYEIGLPIFSIISFVTYFVITTLLMSFVEEFVIAELLKVEDRDQYVDIYINGNWHP